MTGMAKLGLFLFQLICDTHITVKNGDSLSLTHSLRRLSYFLLGRNEKQRRGTAMTAVAAIMMVCCSLVMRMLVLSGIMNMQLVLVWAALAPVGLMVALVLIRSGFSERFSDPALSQFQMVWALSFNAAAYAIAGPVRALVLPVLVIIVMFGIFSRERRETLLVMLYAMAVYTLAILATLYLDTPRPTTAMLLAHMTIVLVSLLAGTMMCLQVQSIRARLRKQKQKLESALQQIQEMAMRDHLTGLVNRRQMSELMDLELRRGERSGRPLLLAQLDIDHFKAINDTHGHAVGDLALKGFADTALAHVRNTDVLSRWGGEEFVLLLCDTQPCDAVALLERVRTAVQAYALPHGVVEIRMTVSIGWAQHHRGESLEETLQRADHALYDAKRNGRNRVTQALAPTPAVAPRHELSRERLSASSGGAIPG